MGRGGGGGGGGEGGFPLAEVPPPPSGHYIVLAIRGKVVHLNVCSGYSSGSGLLIFIWSSQIWPGAWL